MAMGKNKQERQQELWVATTEMPQSPGHPFYRRLNELLKEGYGCHGFDEYVEGLCGRFYHAELGRPGIPPGVYFRMLLIGYFEGIDSERGIAWRCADSRTLSEFLGFGITDETPDHSSLSVIRHRIDLETHKEVFAWVLKLLAEKGLLKGKTLGVDATTLEANAAMRSIIRRDSGDSYNEFLTKLAQASGIATPTREDLVKLDKNRKNKGSNDDWYNPNDPDAKIMKMKDGRTHLSHKAEHAVDLATGTIVAVTIQPADRGDGDSLWNTLDESAENLRDVTDDPKTADCIKGERIITEVVTDKGYHSNDTCRDAGEASIRTYVSEPDKGRRKWIDRGRCLSAEQSAVYANRRRIRGKRGKALLRKRGELLERPFAHCYETGAMRRTHLRNHGNILKRLLIHVAGFNLGLAMRAVFGIGKPRRAQDGLFATILRVLNSIQTLMGSLWRGLERFGRNLLQGRPRIVLQTAA